MADRCDGHYTYVAIHPKRPGAYASCTDDERFWPDFKRREEWAGATVKRVTCNEAQKLLGQYLDWMDEQDRWKREPGGKRRSASTRVLKNNSTKEQK